MCLLPICTTVWNMVGYYSMHATTLVNVLCPSQCFGWVFTTPIRGVAGQIEMGGTSGEGMMALRAVPSRGVYEHAPLEKF